MGPLPWLLCAPPVTAAAATSVTLDGGSSSGPSLEELNSSSWVSLTKGEATLGATCSIHGCLSTLVLCANSTGYVLFCSRIFFVSTVRLDITFGYFAEQFLPVGFYGLAGYYYSLPTKPLIFISLINGETWSCQTNPPNLCQWPSFNHRIIGNHCVYSFQWIAHALSVLRFVVGRINSHAEPTQGSHDSSSFGGYRLSLACRKAAPTASWWMREFEHLFTPEAWQTELGDRLPLQKKWSMWTGKWCFWR